MSDSTLHPETARLIASFSLALKDKLLNAQEKYGYTNDWSDPRNIDYLKRALIEHINKGDPRDVAAYAMFLWYHGQSTTFFPLDGEAQAMIIDLQQKIASLEKENKELLDQRAM